jgi:hypothetical protein
MHMMAQGPTNRASLGLAALVLLAAAGCSPPKAVVSGTVSYKGQPVTTGEVHFLAPDGQSRSGLITAAGAYQVDDAPVGPVTVTVVATQLVREAAAAPPSPNGTDEPAPPARVLAVPLVPPKYNDRQTSGLHYTIAPGRQTIPLDLQD